MRPIHRLGIVVKTLLQARQDVNVAVHLAGKFAQVAALELLDLGLLLGQARARAVQLAGEKLSGVFRSLRLLLDVFIDEQGSQLRRYLLRQGWRGSRIDDAKSRKLPAFPRRLHKLDLDVLAHLVDEPVRAETLPQLRVQMKLFDDPLQPRAAQDLLRHALQLFLQIDGDVGDHVLLWNLLLFHQDEGLGTIHGRQQAACPPGQEPAAE